MSAGRLVQINSSNGGLPKLPVSERVLLTASGVNGDRQRNRIVHGGPNKAVLMIAAEVVDELSGAGHPVRYGSLGENLTVSGLDPHLWRHGQRYRLGEDAVIELTTLRAPCDNLRPYTASDNTPVGSRLYDERCKAGDVSSPHWGYGGFYARVIRGGLLVAGAPVTLESDLA